MSKYKSFSLVSKSDTFSLGIGLGLLYWFFDAAINAYLSYGQSFWNSLMAPTIDQVWTRSFIFCLMIIFSLVIRLISNKRRTAENHLIESKNRFGSLLTVSSDGVLIHDGEYIITANQKLAEMLGHKLEEISDKPINNFFDEESQKRISRNLRSEHSTIFQVTALKQNGKQITLEFSNQVTSYNSETAWIATLSVYSFPIEKSAKNLENSDHYHKLLQNSNDPLFVYGLTNENSPDLLLEVSQMASKKFGYSPEEYKKLSIIEIIVPEERDNILPVFQTLIDFKHSIFETEILTKNKDRVPVEISSHLFDLDNRPMIISTLREIAERKKATQLLRDSEKQYHRLFDKAPIIYFSMEPNGNIIAVNEKWSHSFGYSKEDVINNWFGDYLSRSSLDLFRAFFADLIETKEQIEIELEICNKDKTLSKMLLIATAAQDRNGDFETAQCMLLDNSRHENVIEAKQKQKKWLEQIIDNASDIIFSIKPDGTISNVNPSFEKMLGNLSNLTNDSKFVSCLHSDDIAFVNQAIEKCLEGENVPTIEVRLKSIAKDYIPVELTFSAFYDRDKVIGLDCIGRRISLNWPGSKSKENILKEYQNQCETLLDYACIINQNLEIVYTNDRHQELSKKLGLKSNIIGHNLIETYAFESDDSRSAYSDVFNKTISVFRDVSCTCADNKFLFETKIVPIYFGDEVSFALLIIKDVSSQREAEAVLKKSEAELSVIFNNTEAILALVDKDRKIVKINHSGIKFTGRPEEELLGERGGEALGCLYHLDDPRGCGFGPNCDKCVIRGTITKTFKTGLNHHKIPTKLPFEINGAKNELHLLISTTVIDSIDDLILVSIENITSQKMAKKSLRESEQTYRTLTESLPGLVFRVFCQENNRIQFFNDLALSLTGYSDDELCTGEICSLESLIHKQDRARVTSAIQDAINKKEPFEIEYRLLHKNGDIKYCIERGQPIFDSENNAIRIDGVIFDISERKKAEEALLRSEEKYRSFIQNFHGIAYRGVMKDWSVVFFHGAVEEITGYTEEEFLSGKIKWDMIIHPKDIKSLAKDESIKSVAGYCCDREYRIIHKNGQIRWVQDNIQNAVDKNEVIKYIQGVIYDITERKQSEQCLRESEEKFRSIVELSVDGIALVDKDCKIIEWNLGEEIITGFKKEDVLGHYFYDIHYQLIPEQLKSDQHYQTMKSSMLDTSRTGQSPYLNKFIETEIVHPNGNTCTVEILSFPINTEDGIMICSITRDITDKKLLEEELSKAEKLESIGVLAGGIAHDFNNILTAILGNISLAKMDTIANSDINTRLVEAEKASERAQDLTRQLLTFSKGGAPVKKAIFIQNLIKESVGFAMHGSNVKSILNIDSNLSTVDVDAGQISQVINNLIINANQAMPDGGEITVTATNVEINDAEQTPLNNGQYVKIVISDQGVGIPSNHLKRIFDPYFTTKQKGSGLGLATTYSIIKNHEGHIDVESKSGAGTTFSIHLPVSYMPEEIEINESVIQSAGGGKILVMDDEATIRMVTGVALTKVGYEVEFANDGQEAVDKYKASFESGSPYDLIFMDLTIPGGMGGQEALEKIKEIDPSAKAIVSSGYCNNPVMADHEKFGFCGVITKPYKAEDLNRLVYQILHGNKISV